MAIMIHVVVPHLMPLVSFVTLMLLMDNFRVFEPIIGFQAEAHAQFYTFIQSDLREAGNHSMPRQVQRQC